MKKYQKKQSSASIDRSILAAREEGLTLVQIGKRFGMSRQGVHSRLKALAREGKKRSDDVLVELLQRTNRLLAGVIVRICAVQTTGDRYPIEVLTGLGLTANEIAEALGTSEASINVTKRRARVKNTPSPTIEETIQ